MSKTPRALLGLRWIANLHVIGGLSLAVMLWLPAFHPILLRFIYGDTPITNPQQTIFWICILGPTIASWGVLCRISVDYFAEQPNKRTYQRLVFALLVWAPLDTTMCISQVLYLAAILNASVVILFWFLCYRLWRKQLSWNQ